MRKNSIRKLIHGILDLLPLFVIPIFAININQKSVEPISIEVQEQISVDFNQIVSIHSIENYTNLTIDRVNDYELTLNGTATNSNLWLWNSYGSTNTIFTIYANHKYLSQGITLFKADHTAPLNFSQFYTQQILSVNEDHNISAIRVTAINNLSFTNYDFKLQLYDLTQMYGEGNEPTVQEFNTYFTDSYYPCTESQKMLVNKPSPITYDDTDIGSQFLYSLYISTDNYFNMNNVFNLNSVYQWFELNIFGGSAPLSIYIVWNIIIYELVMDLLMLLYALFMFFIDACQKLIDKPLESIK